MTPSVGSPDQCGLFVLVLFSQPKELLDENATQKDIERGYWGLSRRLLAESDFMRTFAAFQWDALSHEVLEQLHHYALLPEFAPEVIQRHSRPAALLSAWILALDRYYNEHSALEPKRLALRAAQAAAAHEENALAAAQGHLVEIRKGLQELRDELADITRQRDQLKVRQGVGALSHSSPCSRPLVIGQRCVS